MKRGNDHDRVHREYAVFSGFFASKLAPTVKASGVKKGPRIARPLIVIIPMLWVGMQPVTLCLTGANGRDAERLKRHSHAERGNDHES